MQVDSTIIKKTEQCVMCGLCLPHCPTYTVSQTESESPRGRISLIRAYLQGQLQTSDGLTKHLESCTGCFSCQRVCPAKVEYDHIIDAGRTAYRKNLGASKKLMQKIALVALTTSWGQQSIRKASALIKHLPWLRDSITGQLLAHVQKKNESRHNITASKTMIFPGCTGNVFDQTTLDDLLLIMHKLGIEPHIPTQIFCCGALAQHSGLLSKAQQQRGAVQEYCSQHNIQQIITFASGCSREFQKYASIHQTEHIDAHAWLVSQNKWTQLSPRSLPKKVLLHIPCSMDTQTISSMRSLLALIPDLDLIEFEDNINCCGAGGMQLISPNKTSSALALNKINQIRNMQPNIIVSANIGCALQLRRSLAEQAMDIEVIHPITLFARQLQQ